MRAFLSICFVCLSILGVTAKIADLDSLRRVLRDRSVYMDLKQRDIDKIKLQFGQTESVQEKLHLLNSLYREYSTFQFDSAMVYVNRMQEIAGQNNIREYSERAAIHKAFLLTTSGLFHEAIGILDAVNRQDLPPTLLPEYFIAYEWAYSMLAEYAAETEYAQRYYKKELEYQDSLVETLKPGTAESYYWRAEKSYRVGDFKAAREMYLKSLKGVRQNERRYAQSSYGLALTELALGNPSAYRNWLIEAALSDQVCPLKENLAMQELALDLSNDPEPDLKSANDFLHYAVEDAMYYGNRLRLIEISQKIPGIVRNYELQLQDTNRHKSIIILVMMILAALLGTAIFIVVREHKKLINSRKEVQQTNDELKDANAEIKSANLKLESSIIEVKRQKLVTENCITLFMELTAAYINKLNVFQATVQRKIKANQVEELRRYTNPSKMTDAEAKEFFINFDQALLRTFPNFIRQFNNLLIPENRIVLNEGELLNLDLRIFALIRLGIKDSSKIAVLLNYSPQTIYNHRSTVKSHAINRDTFERDIARIE